MPKQVRVNIRSVANVSLVRKEVRNGRELIIVPSATLPDDIVMNGIKYPAEEIEASYASLDRTPAPHGHPLINGQFISATDPEGINIGYIGAWNENVRRENGRVLMDKVIDVEVANRSDDGKAVLAAIDAEKPIHTSTGLLCSLEGAQENDGYDFIARGIYFDHDAILLNEEGAATPEQGVGMLVNKAKDPKTGEEIEVINSAIEWADRDLDWAVTSVVDALERRDKASLVDRLKSAIIEAFSPMQEASQKNESEDDMAVSTEQFEELSTKVNGLAETLKGLPDMVANAVKPLTDNLADLTANQKKKDNAELEVLVNSIVKAGIMDEAAAGELTLNAAKALAPKGGKAANLNSKGKLNAKEDDEFAGVDLNADMEGEAK